MHTTRCGSFQESERREAQKARRAGDRRRRTPRARDLGQDGSPLSARGCAALLRLHELLALRLQRLDLETADASTACDKSHLETAPGTPHYKTGRGEVSENTQLGGS